MSKPYIHALSSAKKYGGTPECYLDIHSFLDSTKSVSAIFTSRLLSHNSWFISTVIPRVFGETFVNSEGRVISSRQVAEDHCAEDFNNKFIPSGQDVIDAINIEDWMENGKGFPPSHAKIVKKKSIKNKTRIINYD